MNEPEPLLAELTAGHLDHERLATVIADIATQTKVIEVIVKGASTARSDGSPWELQEAASALQTGSIRGVQVRYQWQGDEWWDTFLRDGDGVRLVRMKQEFR
jgi:transcriptional regulator of nitric oxide reductase